MSSPLPYAPYQSHRRGASSVSSIASTSGREQGAAAAQLSSSSTSSSSSIRRAPLGQQSSSPTAQANGPRLVRVSSTAAPAPDSPRAPSVTVNGLASREASGTLPKLDKSAPPPLRKLSTTRPVLESPIDLSSLRSNGKGKAREGARSPLGQHGDQQDQGVSSYTSTYSSATLSPISASTPTAPDSLAHHSIRGNGSSKRHSSYSPLASAAAGVPLRAAHTRTASGGVGAPALPHQISTAQRLRSSHAQGADSSANTSPSATPRSSSPAPRVPLAGHHGRHNGTLGDDEALLSEGLGRRTNYRPGFQPKGVYRIRTDEFAAARMRQRQTGRPAMAAGAGTSSEKSRVTELENQRLDRRLEKLVALHYEDPPVLSESAAAEMVPLWLPNTIRRLRIRTEEDRLMREEEQQIVKWEDDSARKSCAACQTAFSFTVRKHHCRLCGRTVCASPHLPLPANYPTPSGAAPAISDEDKRANESKCSGLIVAVPSVQAGRTRKIRDVPRWDEVRIQGQDGDLRHCAMRVCKDCRETILHRQYMLDDGSIPQYVKLYEALVTLQREIEQSLPEFQEMVLGLQKQDAAAALGTDDTQISDPLEPPTGALSAASIAAAKAQNRTNLALQRDAAQARKQLLANFANYDLIAKKIRNIDEEGNASLARLKVAVATRANIFLQANMFPLQNLPKLNMSRPEKSNAKAASSQPAHQRKPSSAQSNGASDSSADARARDIVANDPAAARESLSVLEQQLSLVRQYAASASKSRKFQDASSLQASAHELETEIARLRRLGIA